MPRKKEPAANHAPRPRGRPRINGRAAESPAPEVGGKRPPASTPGLLDFYSAQEIPAKRLEFLWEPYLPFRACTVLYGPLQRGKSTVARAVAAAISRGQDVLGADTFGQLRTLWFASEEDVASVVAPRLGALHADLHRIAFPQCRTDGTRRRVLLPDHSVWLRDTIRAFGASLLVFDPIKAFVGGDAAPDSGAAARAVVDCLTEVCAETDSAALLLMHPRKGGRGSAVEQISGNMEWLNCPRSALLVTDAPDVPGSGVLIHHKTSLSQRGATLRYRISDNGGLPSLEWLGTTGHTLEQVADAQASAADRDAIADARAFLRLWLDGEPRRASDLEKWGEQAGIRPMTLRRAKAAEGIQSKPVGGNDDRFWVWAKPEGGWR